MNNEAGEKKNSSPKLVGALEPIGEVDVIGMRLGCSVFFKCDWSRDQWFLQLRFSVCWGFW